MIASPPLGTDSKKFPPISSQRSFIPDPSSRVFAPRSFECRRILGHYTNRQPARYQSRADYAKLRAVFKTFQFRARRELWLIQRSAKIRRALANRKRAGNIVARHAKARATQSSSIAIAVTKSVREISKETSREKGHKRRKRKIDSSRSFLCLFVADDYC